jgi:hypothetical protein
MEYPCKNISYLKKTKIMARKPGLGSLLLLGAAAFGAYKYSQMSELEKKNLKDKGKKFVDDNLGGLKNAFGGRGDERTSNSNSYNPQG